MRKRTELVDEDTDPDPSQEDWTVPIDGTPSRFPFLAKLGAGLVAGAVILAGVAFVVPPLLPSAMTRAIAERIAGDILGRNLEIRGDHAVRLLPSFRLSAENLVETERSAGTGSFTARALEIEVGTLGVLAGAVDVRRLALIDPVFVIDLDRRGATTSEKPEFRRDWGWWRDMDLRGLSVDNGTVRIVGGASGRALVLDALALRDTEPGPDAAADGIAFAGRGVLNGREVMMRATGSDPRLFVTGNRWPVTLDLSSALLTARFEGALAMRERLRGDGSVSIESPDLDALNGWLRPMFPARPATPLRVAGDIDLAGATLRMNSIRLSAGATELRGRIQLRELADGTVEMDGELDAQTLDLGGGLEAGSMPLALVGFPSGRLDLGWQRLLWRSVEIGPGAAVIERPSAARRISVSIDEADVYGGDIRGAVTMDDSEGMYALNAELRIIDVELGPFLAISNALRSAPLSGQTTINANLFSVGGTPAQLFEALQGDAEVVVRDGVLAVRELVEGVAPQMNAAIPFSTLNGTFRIRQGLAESDDMILRAPEISLVGKGRIDLANWTLDVDVGRLGNGAETAFSRFRIMGSARDIRVEAVN